MKQLAFAILLLCTFAAHTQVTDLYKTDGIENAVHKANIGKITFMNGNIPLDKYRESDFLSTFSLAYKSDLNIRVFMDNSVMNYLHQLAPELPADTLAKSGNLQFSFIIDHKLVYKENIHHGCNFGSGGNKNTSTTFRIPFTSSKGEDWWAMYMWERFMTNGGSKALTEGQHQLKVEIRPYVQTGKSEVKTGRLVAAGSIRLIIKKPTIKASEIAVQPVRSQSNWEVSNTPFDKKKIEALNKAIAVHDLKEITSVIVIHEGKLLLEEYFNGADRNTLHDTRSAGKSFTSTLMGMAIQDGFIKDEDQVLSSFYDLKQYDHYEARKDSITIKNLLTMSSAFEGSDADGGSPGNEENMYPQENWVKFTLGLPMDPVKRNGGKWDYFTAGVVLLGDILHQSIPGGLEQYADKNLFKPLGITQYQWQYTPQKVVNTAGSLQMTSLEYAKYAQLYQNKGKWNGKQIIPEEWVEKTLTRQIRIPERDNQYYGFLFWNKTVTYKGKNYDTFYCAGNGGNEFIIFKDLPLTIIITSQAYNKPYAHQQADSIVKDYILPAVLQ